MKKIFKQTGFVFILTIAIQFAGCGGADIQSAKLYRQQHNWVRADQMLQQALKSDPESDEGWALYMQNLYDLSQYEKIADLIDTARLYAIKNRATVEMVRHNTWVQLFKGGDNAFQQNPDSKEQQQAAIGLLESAKKVAPDQPETYEELGDVYYAAGDTAKGIATYQEALAQVRSVHDQGVALGLRMRMEPSEVESAVGGAPSKDTTINYGGSDSVRIYNYRSNDGFFYFERAAKPPHKWQLTGWRFTATTEVGMLPMRVSVTPYVAIGNYYYNKGNAVLAKDKSKAEDYFNEAVPMYVAVQRLDPTDERAAALITDIYTKLQQPEKAKAFYEKMLAEHPSKSNYVAYGASLSNSGDYEGATNAFEKALAIDPGYGLALYDLGATYRSWAAADQKKLPPPEKKNPADKKNPKPEQADPVRTKLEKSTDYFERDIAINKRDYTAYINLLDNYDILGKKDKTLGMVGTLESLKNTDAGKDADYWDALGKIYVRVNRTSESAEAFKKADQLRK